jgi:hypothetical protein
MDMTYHTTRKNFMNFVLNLKIVSSPHKDSCQIRLRVRYCISDVAFKPILNAIFTY